jgi:hypothetical protein
LVVEIRPCNARQQSYHSDPSHVKHSTKIRGVSRDTAILGRGLSLEVARSSKLFSFALHIYWLLKFGAATRASEATTVIPFTSEIVPKFGGVSHDHPYLGL